MSASLPTVIQLRLWFQEAARKKTPLKELYDIYNLCFQ